MTGGGSGGLNQPYSSIDEAYHYYGMKNPLEPDNSKASYTETCIQIKFIYRTLNIPLLIK